MIDLQTAREILDFSKRIGAGQRADEQLEGAVALHNILDRHGVAYLADEVGMGKTYVALGALALFRHLNPRFRVLVIAPRENIQNKWAKELRNFVAHNYRFPDLRVKGLDQRPVRRLVSCNSLLELLHETALDPDRDFFMRMTSFSLAIGGEGALKPDDVAKMRESLRAHLPWLSGKVFDLRNKQTFKDSFASAVCCGLPEFDLVIIDEAHNLKHGFSPAASARNRVLGLAFGRDPAAVDHGLFPNYARRAKRVLLLSATPVEETYKQLWHQLDVFGVGSAFQGLARDDVAEEDKKSLASQILIRRVTTINVGAEKLTKNLYRREWRSGGVHDHDVPIKVTDPRQRLTVALVQKKVSELLNHDRFNASFQVGMLASFESFLQTTKVLRAEAATTFDDPEQADDAIERDGIDVANVNRIADSYRKRFGAELPHPKMDALVSTLGNVWETGEKALVFVRRVASVKEIKRKLDERYDQWLLSRLRSELPEQARPRFEKLVAQYRNERRKVLERGQEIVSAAELDTDDGGADTFFAWFFRGEGPANVISGVNIQQRFMQRGTAYATFFEDNYVAAVLGCTPAEVEKRLGTALGLKPAAMRSLLRENCIRFLPQVKKLGRADRFEAVQAAAIEALKERPGPHQNLARIVWEERFASAPQKAGRIDDIHLSFEIGRELKIQTFFTELRRRPELRKALWPEPKSADDRREAFREQELRRLLLSTAARLGHGLIDLYIMTIRRIGSMELRAQANADAEGARPDIGPINEYLGILDRQRRKLKAKRGWSGFDELADMASNFELILDVNLSAARETRFAEWGTMLGRLLRQQQPTGGMAGQVNQTLVRQFRMPGYPLVLITTDLLQEGEDLHTFCSAIHHYGISWTPSAMEQRTGRIDRVRSQTDRRLAAMQKSPEGGHKLQVYFPHLQDTVEVLQVRRVLDRMDIFLRLMHEGLTAPGREERRIDTRNEFHRVYRPLAANGPLRSSFPVRPEHLEGKTGDVQSVKSGVDALVRRIQHLPKVKLHGLSVEWETITPPGTLMGTARLRNRVQPFTISLDLFGHWPRLRCVSPVGKVYPGKYQAEIMKSARRFRARIGAVSNSERKTFDLTVEEDVVLADDAQYDAARLESLLKRVLHYADQLEQEYLPGFDQILARFRKELESEIIDAR